MPTHEKSYNSHYSGPNLDHIAFPLGGIGAGMICIGGTGDFTAPLFTETGYGIAGVRDKKPFIEVRSGAIETIRIDYTQFAES